MTPDHPLLVRERRAAAVLDLMAALLGVAIALLLSSCAHSPPGSTEWTCPPDGLCAPYDPCGPGEAWRPKWQAGERAAFCLYSVDGGAP